MHQGDEEWPDVGHLDDDGEVRWQVPALWDLRDNERQLHPQAVDGDPGAHPEETRQQVGEEGHGGDVSGDKQELMTHIIFSMIASDVYQT